MKPSVFLNDMLTKGAILGGVMLLSNIAETAMLSYGTSDKWLIAMSIESIAATALYIWLVLRFTRGYANLVIAERKEMPYFTYGNGLAYVVSISMLTGVVVALGGYIFRHYVVGYENYISNYMGILKTIFAETEMPSSMVSAYEQMFKTLESQDEPTMISVLLSGVWSYLVSGTIIGLIIAAFTKREPNIFDKQDE